MAYPVATSPYSGSSANPAYSGIYIPEIWSGKLLAKFYDATVLAAIANTDYEGEISSFGDKVHIRQRPTINIRDYEVDQALSVDRPSSDKVELNIDQGKYFNLVIDDVIATQSDLNLLDMWAEDASEQMKIVIDGDILSGIASDAHATNSGTAAGRISQNLNLGTAGSAVSVTSNDVIDLIIAMGQALDENNVPETGRWMVIPAWMSSRIKTSDLKDASLAGDGTSIMRNGRLGQIDRFTLYMSNQLPQGVDDNAGEFTIYAGHPVALTFASQLTKMETLRSEQTFGDLMRGLQVYGYEVVKPEGLVAAVVEAG